ncbi:hypothetical protein E2C01_016930 [Portunus trituberculatus]|uniref:Uncharacterized protein n=1 Tax=Portunus trituberculatus TaxID=210409 RepID=A0A5B7DS83_PORTR|nr:hypothetical protein [Portunus trituberculatus]
MSSDQTRTLCSGGGQVWCPEAEQVTDLIDTLAAGGVRRPVLLTVKALPAHPHRKEVIVTW